MKVVVLTGPESAGKSSLCTALAQRFGAPVVREYVREYIELHQRDTCYADVEIIAREQWRREQEARALQPPLLLLDTHLLSNRQWSLALFGQSPGWIDQLLQQQHYDAVFLLSPDGLPWQADGQRCQPELATRQAFHTGLEHWLVQHRQPLVHAGGSWADRLGQIGQAIAALP
ncbi:AAA family ATPase [Thiopseudomonas denitrificans]|uniref:Nicotinamide riboside kinase n=1 Tax=Thiopseudomonas denitrificans TaxID=1501432 RepID=A0A4V3D4X9_9GAMM|nr:AAA family ATPase [Thiopseudomonas denitrificans]TDQ37857.1 nicotinamide riboside kinase [Thiopseudomonas denitrificans]